MKTAFGFVVYHRLQLHVHRKFGEIKENDSISIFRYLTTDEGFQSVPYCSSKNRTFLINMLFRLVFASISLENNTR